MIIKNGKIITWNDPNQILEGYAIQIKEGVIERIEKEEKIEKQQGEEVVDAHSQYIMPGNICAHTHFYGAYSRGMPIPGEPAKNFIEILNKLWWKLDRAIDLVDIEYSTYVCLIDAIKHGTTTLIDHHASPSFINGSLFKIAETALKTGARVSLCYEVTDRGGERLTDEGIKENLEFLEYARKEKNDLISALFGMHACITLSDRTLDKIKNRCPQTVGYHIHVAEDQIDEIDSEQKYGIRIIDRLNRFGMLNNQTVLAHCVHIDEDEMELIKNNYTWVSHQPRSNMNNAVGVADIGKMLDKGIKICIGNDGFSNSMWDEWKTTYLVHKLWSHDPRKMPADQVIKMGVYNNGKLVSKLFNKEIGCIKPGAQADLIFVNYQPFTEVNEGNLPWHIIFGFRESMITDTMVNGKFLMRDNKLTTIDEEKIISEARKRYKNIWQKVQSLEE